MPALFEIPFFKLSCSNWKQKKKELYKLVKNQELARHEHNIFLTSKNVPFNNTDDYINKFTNLFAEEFTKFAKKCNYKTLRFKDIWTVVYDENDYQTPHTHGPIGWSGILYYEYDAKQPSTVFIQPWHNIKTGLTSMRSLDTQEGDMIFFPSFVMHFCPANHLKKKRKIISWDLQGVPNQK